MPVALTNTALIALGTYLVTRAIMKTQRFDTIVDQLKQKHQILSQLIE